MTKAFFQAQEYAHELAAAGKDSAREELIAACEAATIVEALALIHLAFLRLRNKDGLFSSAHEQLGKTTKAALDALKAYDKAHPTEAPQDGTPSAGSRE